MSHAVDLSHPIDATAAQSQAPSGLASGAPLAVPISSGTETDNFSRTHTMTSDDNEADPSRTLTDLHTSHHEKSSKSKGDSLPAESTLGKVERDKEANEGDPEKAIVGGIVAEANTLKDLPAGRKSILLLCFCLSMFSQCLISSF